MIAIFVILLVYTIQIRLSALTQVDTGCIILIIMRNERLKNSPQEFESLVGDFAPSLNECDPLAFKNLASEIGALKRVGFDVSTGKEHDEAYSENDKVMSVYAYLDTVNDAVEELSTSQSASWLGYVATSPCKWSARRSDIQKKHYMQQDEIREAMLYGSEATDSMQWHKKRGRASALLTIAYAHQLAADSQPTTLEKSYSTMSGPLDSTIFEYTFSSNVQHIGGMSLESALNTSETKHSGTDPDIASLKSQKRLVNLDKFIHAPNSEGFIDVVKYCTDSLGIRSRMHEMGDKMTAQMQVLQQGGVDLDSEFAISVGSGTALSVLEVMRQLRESTGSCPTAILVDQDPISLAAAVQLANKMGLGDKVEIHCERLFSKIGKPLSLDGMLQGRQVILSEDAGLREYLPNRLYKSLGTELWRSVKPGGMMATANMNINRPQSRFLHLGMGWQPSVQMRSIEGCIGLHEAIGIDPKQMSAQVTHDGLYTAYYSLK